MASILPIVCFMWFTLTVMGSHGGNRGRRGCPVFNPVCPCSTFENGCFVCKCLSVSSGAASDSSSGAGAANVFGGFIPGVFPGGQKSASSGAASGSSSRGGAPSVFGGFIPGVFPGVQQSASSGVASDSLSVGGSQTMDPTIQITTNTILISTGTKSATDTTTHTLESATTTPTTPITTPSTTPLTTQEPHTISTANPCCGPLTLGCVGSASCKVNDNSCLECNCSSSCPPYPVGCAGSTFCEVDANSCLVCKCSSDISRRSCGTGEDQEGV